MVCPVETPEGGACGLVKNLALMTYVTVGSPKRYLIDFLDEWNMENLEELTPAAIPAATKVFMNGVWLGIHREADKLIGTLRELRRRGDVSSEVSFVRDREARELRINTDSGRCCRPLFVVEPDQSLAIKRVHIDKLRRKEMKWQDLLSSGLVEFIDVAEEETAMIAMFPSDLLSQFNPA